MTTRHYDVVLVGAGLANSLIALRLRRERPELKVAVLEPELAAPSQTWCLFRSDLEARLWDTLPLPFTHTWAGYDVAFPAHEAQLATDYACLTGEALRAELRQRMGGDLFQAHALELAADRVLCDGGQTFTAGCVIDGRGASPSENVDVRFQKFLGVEVELRRPHDLQRPVVMDARVRQIDGFRFLYVLPLGAQRLLVEDTRYSDGPELDAGALESEALRYARGRGWPVGSVIRRERGALAVVLSGRIDRYWAEAGRHIPQVGVRGLFFHPTTGYSFADALATAELVVETVHLGSAELAARLQARSKALWNSRGFYRLLNRMLFQAGAPEARYRILERFYALPAPLIERFYAGRSTLADKARILSGRPPVPVGRAVKAAVQPWFSHAAH